MRRGQKEIRRDEKRKDSPANKGGRWKNCTQAWRKGERRDSRIKGTEGGMERDKGQGERAWLLLYLQLPKPSAWRLERARVATPEALLPPPQALGECKSPQEG